MMRASGILALTVGLLLAGCDGKSKDPGHDHSHGHVHTAPHGGTLVVLGDEFAHLEWVLDSKSGALTIYVLDGEAASGTRISAPALDFELKVGDRSISASAAAVASSLSGETVGDTSTFAATIPELIDQERFEVTVAQIIVRGVEFVGVSFPYPEGNESASHDH